jgi:hypothetical protein
MIENKSLRIGGGITLWNLSEYTDQAMLEDRLAALGLKDFAPPTRTPVSALREAVAHQVGGPRVLIRPLEGNDGWVATQETRGAVVNQYDAILTAKIDENLHISFHPYSTELADKITAKFNEHLGYVHAADVSNSLVKILGHLMGLSLRPRGAIYWLADTRLPTWADVASAVEECSVGKGSCVYLFRNIMDMDSCKGIQDALVREIEASATDIDSAVRSGELGKRALNNRVEQAEELRDKIRTFEGILNTTLPALAEMVEKVEVAAARAVLIASTAA